MPRDLKATRDRLGLSTAKLAAMLRVNPVTGHRWMNGSRPVPDWAWRFLDWRIALANLDDKMNDPASTQDDIATAIVDLLKASPLAEKPNFAVSPAVMQMLRHQN